MTKLSKNIFYNLIGQGIVLVISFAAVRLIFHKLGAEALGIIYFTTSLNSILMALLEMGVSSVVVREVSGHFDLDKSYTKDFMRTFSFFYWGVYMISGLLIFFMAPFFVDKWIHLTSMSSITAISIVRILGITSIMVLPRSFYLSAISGLQKMEFNNFINIVITGLQQVGAFFILFFGGGLMFVIYWLAASYIVEVVVYFFVSAYFFSFAFLVPRFSFMPIKKNLKFISSTALISFFNI